MIARTTRGVIGVSIYLEKGIKKESKYARIEKDKVIPLFGNLQTFKKIELFLNREKKYKDNYLHITISYSKEDIQFLDSLQENKRLEIKKDIIQKYIEHHTSGYRLCDEVIAYAETHKPILKEENGKERHEHEHIVIALYNPLDDTKLQTTFFNNSFIDDTLQTYINRKYNLSVPREKSKKHEIEIETEIAKNRKYYKDELNNIKTNLELLEYFKENKIEFTEVKTKSNNYFKIIIKDGDSINLRGKGFEHLEKITIDKDFVFNEKKDISELEFVLNNYYENREKQIYKKRSATSRQRIEKKSSIANNDYSLENLNYQQKIFYEHYSHIISNKLQGYFVDTKDKENTKFINKNKKIEIVDKGDKIVSLSNDLSHLQEIISLMLQISIAKKWELSKLKISGNEDFRREAQRQIVQKLREKNEKLVIEKKPIKELKKQIAIRPISPLQVFIRDDLNKEIEQNADKDISILNIKMGLDAQKVLNFAIEKYKVKEDHYEIIDNKIKNKTNRQKPKNVIDFLQKEINITTAESINICKVLYVNDKEIEIKKIQEESAKRKLEKEIEKDRQIKEIEDAKILKELPINKKIKVDSEVQDEKIKKSLNIQYEDASTKIIDVPKNIDTVKHIEESLLKEAQEAIAKQREQEEILRSVQNKEEAQDQEESRSVGMSR